MNITQVREAVLTTFRYNLSVDRFEDRITPFIWGPPGIGKSENIYQIGEYLGYDVVEVRLNSLNPVDVRGFPYLNESTGKGDFALPFYFPGPTENPKRIIFLDELNTALPSNQVTAMEICQNYSIGGRKFPFETLIVAAGNNEEDRGATFEMPAPLSNRFQHIFARPSAKAYVTHGIEKGIDEDIIGFIQFKPTFIHKMGETDKAFPTPRSWSKLSKLKTFTGKFDRDIAASLIGEGAADELSAYIEVKASLPDVEKALDDGIPFKSSERSVIFSFITSLVYKLNNHKNPQRLKNFFKIISVLPDELQVVALHMLSSDTKRMAIQEANDEYYEAIKKFD